MDLVETRMYGIVFSKVDPVSRGVFEIFNKNGNLKYRLNMGSYEVYDLGGNLAFYALDRDIVYLDDLEELLQRIPEKLQELIFVSRHAMKNPRPMFTSHVTGNWSTAELGGKPNTISLANPHTITAFYRELCRVRHEYGLENFECHVEATHHGPTIESMPVTFVEQGSSENDWSVSRGWELLYHVVNEFLDGKLVSNSEPSISIGDLHYLTMDNRIISGETDIGHAIPKYIKPVTEDMIIKAVKMMIDKPTKAYVSWKSIDNETRKVVTEALNRLGIRIIKRT
ncbi:D-aminoacyl-tRNA deacylase [Vulcanisaeta souniana]|uniref:D-aminoacyl-tRNA deacylase n=1 Tax=Vulcanisaeta souniana JCM 11219 TaxID=1293586 RepID=A0A830E9Q5_9CREN|nr:D-aminoacyl-tRNA deacylase [Vulcanisaeta souniana]BDR91276.1 D-tyrosyl-tRNA(Tyr) deacylase [Vulcanisaeta souniana JCM 11219]GGI84925.1 D-tyrosyl-tRNA(Tyr) deacylase [Vulcanisaeta souniana JCM 11219]